MKRLLMLAVGVALALPSVAHAQRLSASAGAAQLTYRFRDSTGTGEQSGMMLRVAGGIGLGRFRIGASGQFGEVHDKDGAFSPRSLRVTTLSASMQPAEWLELGLEAQARAEDRDDGSTLQRLGGPFTRLVADFGGTGLEGLAEAALYPFSSSINTPTLKMALRAAVGARYSPAGGPFMVQLTYRFARLDYQATGSAPAPLTQDESLALEIALRKF